MCSHFPEGSKEQVQRLWQGAPLKMASGAGWLVVFMTIIPASPVPWPSSPLLPPPRPRGLAVQPSPAGKGHLESALSPAWLSGWQCLFLPTESPGRGAGQVTGHTGLSQVTLGSGLSAARGGLQITSDARENVGGRSPAWSHSHRRLRRGRGGRFTSRLPETPTPAE